MVDIDQSGDHRDAMMAELAAIEYALAAALRSWAARQ